MYQRIPAYARFQWLNAAKLRKILAPFFRYRGRGRRGYDQVTLFLWLGYKQLHDCSYRDLESMSGIDHTTFIKFRSRLKSRSPHLFGVLVARTVTSLDRLDLILDSSFVETYSRHDEEGSGYSGYKEKNGFKLHEIIDRKSRLPVFQVVTSGNIADITMGEALVARAPPHLPVCSFAADKGYDSEYFAQSILLKWKIRPAIPVRHMRHDGNALNRTTEQRNRSRSKRVYRGRTEIERYFSRKKHVFNLGEEKTRHLENFRTNCYFTSCLELLESLST